MRESTYPKFKQNRGDYIRTGTMKLKHILNLHIWEIIFQKDAKIILRLTYEDPCKYIEEATKISWMQ